MLNKSIISKFIIFLFRKPTFNDVFTSFAGFIPKHTNMVQSVYQYFNVLKIVPHIKICLLYEKRNNEIVYLTNIFKLVDSLMILSIFVLKVNWLTLYNQKKYQAAEKKFDESPIFGSVIS